MKRSWIRAIVLNALTISVQVFLPVQNDQFIQKIAVINELTAIVPAACFYTAGRKETRFSGSCDSINANILSVLRKVEFKYLLYCSIVIDPPVSGLQIFCQRTFIVSLRLVS